MFHSDSVTLQVYWEQRAPELARDSDAFTQFVKCLASINTVLALETEDAIMPLSVVPIAIHRSKDNIEKLPNRFEYVKAAFAYYLPLKREMRVVPDPDGILATITLIKPESREAQEAAQSVPRLVPKPFVNTGIFYRAHHKRGHLVGYFSAGHQPAEHMIFETVCAA